MSFRTPRALPALLALTPSPGVSPLPANGPGSHFSPPGPSTPALVMLQQGQSPALHSPALPSHGPHAPAQLWPVPDIKEVPLAWGWGCPGYLAPDRDGGTGHGCQALP